MLFLIDVYFQALYSTGNNDIGAAVNWILEQPEGVSKISSNRKKN